MAFVSDMFDQLRDLLNDAADSQVTYANKRLWINRGIRMLWPEVFRVASDVTIAVIADQYDYNLPVAIADGIILSVELETGNGDNRYIRFAGYDVIAGDEDLAGVFRFNGPLPEAGSRVRIKYAAPIATVVAASYAAAQAEAWAGPDRAMELPVLYAMAMIVLRKVDDRQDHTRYSTTQAANGVSDQDLMDSSAVWMGQFREELARYARPLPIVTD